MVKKLALIRKDIITEINPENYDNLTKKEQNFIRNIKEDILCEISFKIKENANDDYINELLSKIENRTSNLKVLDDISVIINKYKEE